MNIQFIDTLPQDKKSRYAIVDINDLFLDEYNPRFASSTLLSRDSGITQNAIINYLVEYGEVCKLADDIERQHGLFKEDIISAAIIDDKLTVLEGNRRIAACKLLLDHSLMDDNLSRLFPLPTPTDETKANIQKIIALVYNNSDDAQAYIASKHTQPNILKWTTIEQYNFYYSQFINGKTPKQIADSSHLTDAREVEKRIREYALFYKIFGLVKNSHPDLAFEAASILPVVTAFMPKLLGGKYKYTLLGVEYNKNLLSYTPLPSQEKLYEKILGTIGEAFFVRPEAKKQSEKDDRPYNAKYRITSDEIKGPGKVEELIDNDIRIPGLKNLILAFRDESPSEKATQPTPPSNSENQNRGSQASTENTPPYKNHGETKDNSEENSSQDDQRTFATKSKQTSFFSDFRYEHLDPTCENNKGLIAVAKELRAISSANVNTGYHKFPLASSFLLRALIEQTLLRLLADTKVYTRLCNNTKKATPELDKMVNEVLNACKNQNHATINLDAKAASDFVACFDGGGTKQQLNKIIHSPAECQPNKEFLDSMANGGLKSLLQRMVDSFE